MRTQLDNVSASMLELDRALGAYGPEAAPARILFRTVLRRQMEQVLQPGGVDVERLADRFVSPGRDAFLASLDVLSPQTDVQRAILVRVTALLNAVGHTRILLAERAHDAMPLPFLIVMGFWLTVLFLGFGVLAQPNATVIGALLIGAASVSAAMFLILELNQPFDGLLRVSDTPLRIVLRQLAD